MWEVVPSSGGDTVRRRAVPGGWLYQVESIETMESYEYGSYTKTIIGWHPPVFVSDKDM
jgi:hypothetical protein